MARLRALNHYAVLTLFTFLAGCALPNARSEPTSVAAVANPRRTLPASVFEFESHSSPTSAVSRVAYEAPVVVPAEPQVAPDGPAPLPERILPGRMQPALATQQTSEPSAESPWSADRSDDPADPFNGQAELSVEQLMAEVQARNPSLQAASAAWRAAAERYPQVVSFDDPMFTGMISPKGIGMDDGGGWMVQPRKTFRGLASGRCAAARQRPRPRPCAEILAILGCGWRRRRGRHSMTIIWPGGRWT